MKKHKLLLSLVMMMLTFTGGFFTGVFFSSSNSGKPQGKMYSAHAPESAKKLERKQNREPEPIKEKVLIGYIQDFRNPNEVDYEHLTHVIFSFAHPTRDGNLLLNGDTALSNLRTIVKKAHKHDTKALLAVGGWYHIKGGESYDYFKAAITKPSSRKKLVNELFKITEQENLDGIDIDFEHPRSKEDAMNLTLFTKELSKKLHEKDKELSIAVNAKVHSVAGTEINNVVFEPSMFKNVDYVNIMAYDGQWDGGYNAANLSPYSYNKNIVSYWTNLFETHNLSKGKLVLGVPFYAQPENPKIKQVSYAAIVDKNPKYANRDQVRMNGTTYHYNGEKSVRKKTKLALDHGFGGMMLWEAGHDAPGKHSLTGVISNALQDPQLYSLKSK